MCDSNAIENVLYFNVSQKREKEGMHLTKEEMEKESDKKERMNWNEMTKETET